MPSRCQPPGSRSDDTAATISAGVHTRNSAPSAGSPGSARKLSITRACRSGPTRPILLFTVTTSGI